MPYLTVDQENSSDIKIHYQDHGSGEPLLFIHGYPFSGTAWEKQEAFFLEKGYRVITYDRRGFGLSGQPSSGYNWDTFAQDLDKLLTHLDLNNLTLIGHSMGSGEITRYAANFGLNRISRVIYISPIPPFVLKTDDNQDGVDQEVFEGFKSAIKKDRYAFMTEFLKNFYSVEKLTGNKNISDEKLWADFQLASFSSPLAFYHCVDTWTEDFREDLSSLRDIPALVIHGDDDKILPYEITGKKLSEKINAELKTISGGSHGIPWTHAEKICEIISEFLERGQIRQRIETSTQSSAELQ